jgi:hypothetical protein
MTLKSVSNAVYAAYKQQIHVYIITFSKNGNAKTMTKILKYISEYSFFPNIEKCMIQSWKKLVDFLNFTIIYRAYIRGSL